MNFPRILIIMVCGSTWSLGQGIAPDSSSGSGLLSNPLVVPDVKKAEAVPYQSASEIVDQDSATLEPVAPGSHAEAEIPELVSLQEKSLYHVVARTKTLPVAAVDGQRISEDLRKVSAAYRRSGQQEAECQAPALSVDQRVKKNPSRVLEIVDVEVRANAACACEIVKAAILATDMKVETVVAIVKTAIEAEPASMRLIAQCAIAVCPDALEDIQKLLAKYDVDLTEGGSAKSAKSAKGDAAALGDEVAATPNPLDFPGGPQGHNLVVFFPPNVIVIPPQTTLVDP